MPSGRQSVDFDLAAHLTPSSALVEEFGVAFVVEATENRAVADLYEATLLKDALHPRIVREGRAAHGPETQRLETVTDKKFYGLARVAPATQVLRAHLYAKLAPFVPEVVESGESYSHVLGLDDEGLYDRVLPTGQVVAASGGE